ncbi:MAG: hypothetical protein PVG71_10545 [Anaerolineae bacterium]
MAGALVALCAPVALGAGGPGRGRLPFTGSWTSIDVDGSFQRLQIGGGGGTVQFHYRDCGCSACGTDEDDNPIYPCVGRGEGTVDGDELSGSMDLWCLSKPRRLQGSDLKVAWTYNDDDDTLSGWYDDTVWSRTDGK